MEGSERVSRPSGSQSGTTFHPSVVLVLDDEGERIAAYLDELLAGLPPAARAWVERLPATGIVDATAVPTFEADLAAALARVTSVHLRDDVRRAGYHVGDANPLILLLGHTTAPALLPAARAAQRVTTQRFAVALRLALLADTRPTDPAAAVQVDEQARDQPWDRLLGWTRQGRAHPEPPLALCLLYEDYDERSWYWNVASKSTTPPPPTPDIGLQPQDVLSPFPAPAAITTPLAPTHTQSQPEDVRYAVAEATFALIASGLVDDEAFREQVRLTMPTIPGGGGEAARRFATLATSRLAFPRVQAERAVGHYEGAALLDAWVRAIEQEDQARTARGGGSRPTRSATPRRDDAARFIRSLRDATEDSEDLAFRRAEQPSPPLSAEGISEHYGLERVHVDPARIFATFRGREIAREMTATGVTVPAALRALDARARVRFGRWHAAAESVWTAEYTRRQVLLAERIQASVLESPAGLAHARSLLSELRQKLIWLQERQEDRVRYRAAEFEHFLAVLAFEAGDLVTAVRSEGASYLRPPHPGQASASVPAALPAPLSAPPLGQFERPLSRSGNTAPLPGSVPGQPVVPAVGVNGVQAPHPMLPPAAAAIPQPVPPGLLARATAAARVPPVSASPDPGWPAAVPEFAAVAAVAAGGAVPSGAPDVLARPIPPLVSSWLLDQPTVSDTTSVVDISEFETVDLTADAVAAVSNGIHVAAPSAPPLVAPMPAGAPAVPLVDPGAPVNGAAAPAPDDPPVAPVAADQEPAAQPATPDQPAPPDPTMMPDQLERLIRLLGQRLGAEDGLLPALPTVAATLLMLLPFLAYAAVALGPHIPLRLPVWHIGAGQLSLAVVLVGCALSLAIGIPTAVIYRRKEERASRVRRLLVAAYTRWWAEQCGRTEDTLRRDGVARLAADVEERLAAVASFEASLRSAAADLRGEASRLEQSLVSGPQGRRDIFVLGGSRYPAGRLRQLHEAVELRRSSSPLDPAHASAAERGNALRQRLLAGGVALLDLDSARLLRQAAAFGFEVCQPYLSGEVVNVVPLLRLEADDNDDEHVPLSALLERATPLYRPVSTDTPRRLVALAAPDDYGLRESMARRPELRLVVTPGCEWLLVAQLVSHGRPHWWRQPFAARAMTPVPPVANGLPVHGSGSGNGNRPY